MAGCPLSCLSAENADKTNNLELIDVLTADMLTRVPFRNVCCFSRSCWGGVFFGRGGGLVCLLKMQTKQTTLN